MVRVPLNYAYIRKRRKQLKLTQEQAAKLAKLANSQKWNQYEHGRIPDPQLSTLEAIAKALRCSVSRLVK